MPELYEVKFLNGKEVFSFNDYASVAVLDNKDDQLYKVYISLKDNILLKRSNCKYIITRITEEEYNKVMLNRN